MDGLSEKMKECKREWISLKITEVKKIIICMDRFRVDYVSILGKYEALTAWPDDPFHSVSQLTRVVLSVMYTIDKKVRIK